MQQPPGGLHCAWRAAGDRLLLVEYGALTLDIALRFRVHALMQWLEAHPLAGQLELTPGIRSLQVHYDAQQCARSELLAQILHADNLLGDLADAAVPSRIVWLPLSWDDPACREAVDTLYDQRCARMRPGARATWSLSAASTSWRIAWRR